MKSLIKFITVAAFAIFALVARNSEAQQIGNFTNAITIGTNNNTIAATATSNIVDTTGLKQFFKVRPGFGIGMSVTVSNSVQSSTNGNINIPFYYSIDGTTNTAYTTNFTWVFAVNGATNKTYTTNIPWSSLDGVDSVVPLLVRNDNQTGTLYFWNADGTATNGPSSFILSRPVPWPNALRGY
jgi:hypothetical protein